MHRFLLRPKWILFHLLCLGGVVLMLNLSLWQWHRLQERKDFNALVEERSDEDVVRIEDLVPPGTPVTDTSAADAVEWRPAQAEGTYLDDLSMLVVNRSQGGAAGSNLVTPLELADGQVLLVNRGFIALDTDIPAAPSGAVKVAGVLRSTEERRFGQLTSSDSAPDDGITEVPRLDLEGLAEELDLDLLPVSLEAQVSVPADSDALAAIAAPELDQGPHLSYAIQWLIFATCVVVGWVFAVRRSIRTHAAEAADAASSGDPDAP